MFFFVFFRAGIGEEKNSEIVNGNALQFGLYGIPIVTVIHVNSIG